MNDENLLKAIGAVVVLNLWNIIQVFLSTRKSKDTKTEDSLEKLKEAVIKLSVEVEGLHKDINNIGQAMRELRSEVRQDR